MTTSADRDLIASLVTEASGGVVSVEAALGPETDLQALGLSSLAFLQLIDAIENDLGVYIDLDGDTTFLRTVDGIVRYVEVQRAEAA